MKITLTRPLCGPCNSTDLSCEDCGFDFDECQCDFETGFVCKICMNPAEEEVEFKTTEETVYCLGCGDPLSAENYWNFPEVAAKTICDDCYVKESIGIETCEENKPSSAEDVQVTCEHGNLHICEKCGIYRLSTLDRWNVIENIELEFKSPTCSCTPEKQYVCSTCNVSRDNPKSEWKRTPTYKATNTTTGTKPAGTTTYYGKCRHYGVPLTFPNNVTVYASSSNSKRDFKDNPDFGLYLDWVWKPTWRSEFIDWPDYDVPTNFEDAYDAIVEMYERAQKGKKVEVGCIGRLS